MPYFNVEVRAWFGNYIPRLYVNEITYPYHKLDASFAKLCLVKEAQKHDLVREPADVYITSRVQKVWVVGCVNGLLQIPQW